MKISVIHATRRGLLARPVINSWVANASHSVPIEYILSVDNTDTCDYDFTKSINFKGLSVIRNNNRSAVDAFNKGAEKATGDMFVCISDDMVCFHNWDLALIDATKYYADFYLKVQDGIQPTLVTLPIFDRLYYNRFGYVWHPDYYHMFCDQEATAVAIMTGRYLKCDLMFTHAHYTTGQSKKDAVNARNDATWIQGEMLFNERLKSNFGLSNTEIVKPYSEISWI